MVSVTMDQIIAFRNSGDVFEGVKLPLKIAYKLNKIKKAVEENGEFYTEKFQEIIDTYARKDEKGQILFSDDREQILIQEGKMEDCNKALQELQDLTIEIENYNLSIDDFDDNIQCTPEDLEVLMPFLN